MAQLTSDWAALCQPKGFIRSSVGEFVGEDEYPVTRYWKGEGEVLNLDQGRHATRRPEAAQFDTKSRSFARVPDSIVGTARPRGDSSTWTVLVGRYLAVWGSGSSVGHYL